VAVIAIHKHRRIGRESVDHLLRWQSRRHPALIVPIAAGDPLFWPLFRAVGNTLREFGGRCGVLQVNAVQLEAAADEVDMGVVEAGQHELAAGIDDVRLAASPRVNFAGAADGDDAVADDGHGVGLRTVRINRPDLRVGQNDVGGGPNLGPRRSCTQQPHTARTKKVNALHDAFQYRFNN